MDRKKNPHTMFCDYMIGKASERRYTTRTQDQKSSGLKSFNFTRSEIITKLTEA